MNDFLTPVLLLGVSCVLIFSIQAVLQHLAALPPESPLTPACSCCCPSLLVPTLLRCDSSHAELLPLNLQLIDQCTLLVSSAVESPLHLWSSKLSALFQEGLLTRLACLRPSFPALHSSRPADYDRLLKLALMALMLVYDTPSTELDSILLHQPLASDRFFPTLLQYFQCMLDGQFVLRIRMSLCGQSLNFSLRFLCCVRVL